MQRFSLLVLTLAHFCVDSYAIMLVPALPFLSERMGFGLAFSGLLAAITSVCSVSQPLLGLWADRMARRYLVLAGLVLAAAFTPLIGIASSYWVLVILLCLGGFGVAAFHPQAFALVGELSGDRRTFGIALFIFGGTMAMGATPLWVNWFGSGPGLEYLPLVAIPGFLLLLVIVRAVPLDNPHIAHGSVSLIDSLRHAGRPLAVITVVVILRSVTGLGIGTFIAFLARERGLSYLEAGAALSAYNTAGVVGSLVFGYLADRIQPKLLTWTAILAACPLLLGYVHLQGPMSYVMLTLGGGLLLSSNSILVAMAQELAPRNAALASSLPLGFSWGLAGLTLWPLGFLADRIGLEQR
jgi:MFS transporter, FSR family, fosmidomycin resistance protein